jgi:hypothetical protein
MRNPNWIDEAQEAANQSTLDVVRRSVAAPMPRFREIEGREYITERRTGPMDRRAHAEARYSLDNVLRERQALQMRLDFWRGASHWLLGVSFFALVSAALFMLWRW